MPGLIKVPGSNTTASAFTTLQHDDALDFLSMAYPTLQKHESSSNIILAHALEHAPADAVLTGARFATEDDVDNVLASSRQDAYVISSTPPSSSRPLWLTLWASHPPSSSHSLDIVLACVSGRLGNYPIFLWTPNRAPSSAWLVSRITPIIERLRACVPPGRVFSAFGMTPLVKAFERVWTESTGFVREPEPFYAAWLTYCNRDTFKESDVFLSNGHSLRRPTMDDLEAVAHLCKEFADDSIYFPLTLERARIQAQELIVKRQIWVYDLSGNITTICAVTRSSLNVSAITKVYTTPRWRKNKCAQHLVRYVTRKLLFECGKDCVVLYVGHNNSAQYVYDKVGFVGLCGKDHPESIEDSLELGFSGTERGHW